MCVCEGLRLNFPSFVLLSLARSVWPCLYSKRCVIGCIFQHLCYLWPQGKFTQPRTRLFEGPFICSSYVALMLRGVDIMGALLSCLTDSQYSTVWGNALAIYSTNFVTSWHFPPRSRIHATSVGNWRNSPHWRLTDDLLVFPLWFTGFSPVIIQVCKSIWTGVSLVK